MSRSDGWPALVMLVTAVTAFLAGCGGSGAGGAAMTRAKVTVAWAERGRVVNAPSSAQSVRVLLQGAAPDGGDINFVVERRPDPGAYVETAESPEPVRQGRTLVTFSFHAGPGGAGDVVGQAFADADLRADGSGIPPAATVGGVASVDIVPRQGVKVGKTVELKFVVRDATGRVLALSPGSVFWTVLDGQDRVQIANGVATGRSRGDVRLQATIDGRVSRPEGLRVEAEARAIILEPLPGGPRQGSAANDVSRDGRVAVGSSTSPTRPQPTRWVLGQAPEGLGFLPGFSNFGQANGVNGDGTVIVGQVDNGTLNRAFRWTDAGGMDDLGLLPGGTFAIALDVSADGEVVVGFGNSSRGEEAWVWTAANGMQGIGDFINLGTVSSRAIGVSGDGRFVVGAARYTGLPPNVKEMAFRWTREDGMQPLGFVHAAAPTSEGAAANFDGSIVVGVTGNLADPAFIEPSVWRVVGGMQSLGPGEVGSGQGVTDDGRFIVLDGDADPNSPFVWDDENGLRSILTYLDELGVRSQLRGYRIADIDAMNGDGSVFVGSAGLNGEFRGYAVFRP